MNTVAFQQQLNKMNLPLITKEGILNVIDMKVEDEKDRLVSMMNHMEDRLTLKMDNMETRLNARMDSIESSLNARMDSIEIRLDQRIDKVELRIDNVEKSLGKRMDLMLWFMGVGFTLLSVLISLFGLAVVNH